MRDGDERSVDEDVTDDVAVRADAPADGAPVPVRRRQPQHLDGRSQVKVAADDVRASRRVRPFPPFRADDRQTGLRLKNPAAVELRILRRIVNADRQLDRDVLHLLRLLKATYPWRCGYPGRIVACDHAPGPRIVTRDQRGMPAQDLPFHLGRLDAVGSAGDGNLRHAGEPLRMHGYPPWRRQRQDRAGVAGHAVQCPADGILAGRNDHLVGQVRERRLRQEEDVRD